MTQQTIEEGVGNQATRIIWLSIRGCDKRGATSTRLEFGGSQIIALQLTLINTLDISSVILKEACKTIVEHDRRGKVRRNRKPDSANVLLNPEFGVVCLDENPLGLVVGSGIGGREGG